MLFPVLSVGIVKLTDYSLFSGFLLTAKPLKSHIAAISDLSRFCGESIYLDNAIEPEPTRMTQCVHCHSARKLQFCCYDVNLYHRLDEEYSTVT